jgi:uncharacterized RDD family membrane protein YckC
MDWAISISYQRDVPMGTSKEVLTIRTPEYVGFQYILAGLGSRATAFLLDTAIRFLFVLVIFVVIMLLFSGLSLDPTGILSGVSKNWIMALGVIAYGMIDLGYFLLFEALWNGQTPGKRQQRLRVIRMDGSPIGWLGSAIRNILRAVDILAGVYPVGFVVMFLSKNSQRIGDYAAGTVVIVERSRGVPKESSALQNEDAEERGDIETYISTLEPKQYQVLRSFIERRDEMDQDHRQQLARLLVQRLLERWEISTKLDISYESFLEKVVESYERIRRAL